MRGSSGFRARIRGTAKANEARLKTASELVLRSFGDIAGFDDGVLQKVLEAIHVAVKEEEAPEKCFAHLKNALV